MPAKGESLEDTLLYQHLTQGHPNVATIREFLEMLAVCHTVIPEMVDGEMRYQAASPGERGGRHGAGGARSELTVGCPQMSPIRDTRRIGGFRGTTGSLVRPGHSGCLRRERTRVWLRWGCG